MYTALDFTLGMIAASGHEQQARRVRRTLAWVYRACREDGVSEQVCRMVVANFEREFMGNPWAPTLPDDESEEDA